MTEGRERFLTAERHRECTRKQLAMTPETLTALRGFGVTPEMSLKLEYFFYSDSPEKGNALVPVLEGMGYSAKCDRAAHDPALVVVTGWTLPIAMEEAALQKWTHLMCSVGFNEDCEFDGWGTPIPSHLAAAAKPATPAVGTADRTVASGGPIERYEKVPGPKAFEVLDKYRREFGTSKLFPFIIGNDDDKARFEEMIDPPMEKIAIHAASLVKATRWYFWWD